MSPKQAQAMRLLRDNQTTEILYGGGAGGGKSYLGCLWLIYGCIMFPGSRWLMGRAILKTLKESTLLTFFRICKDIGLKVDQDFKYNSMSSVITFPANGSEIYLKDLFHYPSDPEFDELGSTEYTGAFLDEASQITQKAYQITMSRLRYRLDEYKLIPKILIATNPTKNFLYAEFYKPWREGKLKEYRQFIPALVQDNPYISKHYIENLKKLDIISKERLLFGNWEYDDDKTKLFHYEKLLDMFTNEYSEKPRERKYMTIDVARFGADKTVIILWYGLFIKKIYSFEKQGTKATREFVEQLAKSEGIPRSQIILDEDGIGGGIVDEMPGIRGFVNNAAAHKVNQYDKTANFANIKSQCYFLLADYVNSGKIGIYKEVPIEIKKQIIEDLEQVKAHEPDKDKKLQVTPKELIKEMIGRSPDFGDAIMMRMQVEIIGEYMPYIATGRR